jgi:predicted dehydrogenase
MNSRRSFIKDMAKAAALSAVPFSYLHGMGGDEAILQNKRIRIGIIGAENSHTIGFGKLFNVDKKFPGVEVTHVWGETEEFARNAMEKGHIPAMVKDPIEMMGKINALIVDHRHGKYHLEAATPFIKEGIPTFIDKPFCYRLEEGKEFLALAKRLGTPITSYSSIAHSYETFDLAHQVKKMGSINQVVRYGPLDMESKYGGVFFYGAHLIQPLMYIFGDDIKKVKIIKNNTNSSASLVFGNGMLASLIFTTKQYGWKTFVETEDGIQELKSDSDTQGIPKNYVDMVQMFRTGVEPRAHKSILKGVAVLEALEKSVNSEQWEYVES